MVDGPLQRAFGVLDADPGERVGAVEDELELRLLVAQVADRLEDQADVLEAGEVRRHHDEQDLGVLDDPEVDVVEALVDVDQDVVVEPAEDVEDLRHVRRRDQLGGLGRRRREQQVHARVVLDEDLLDEVDFAAPQRDLITDLIKIAHRLRAFAVETPNSQAHFLQAPKNLFDLLRDH